MAQSKVSAGAQELFASSGSEYKVLSKRVAAGRQVQKHRLLKFLMLKLMLVEFLELKLSFLSFLSLGFTGDGLEWFKGRWVM